VGPAAFVLSRFSAAERSQLVEGFVEMADLVGLVDRQGVVAAMNNYNRRS
jgi:peptidyl-tRNA hydrolase